MAGSNVKTLKCDCGAEIRTGSAFCFNCGETIDAGPPPPPISKPATGTLNGRAAKTVAFAAEPAPIAIPPGKLVDEPLADPPEPSEPAVSANTRRTRLTRTPKAPVEVEWVENSVSLWYLAGTAILTIVAILLILLAFYFR